MYVCKYVCMCASMYVRMYVWIHVCMDVGLYAYKYVCTVNLTWQRTWRRTLRESGKPWNACTLACVHAYMYVCTINAKCGYTSMPVHPLIVSLGFSEKWHYVSLANHECMYPCVRVCMHICVYNELDMRAYTSAIACTNIFINVFMSLRRKPIPTYRLRSSERALRFSFEVWAGHEQT